MGWAMKLCTSVEVDVNSNVELAHTWDVRKALEDV